MKYLKDTEEQEAIHWMEQAAAVAEKALCLRAKCGAIIIENGEIIGEGYNTPHLMILPIGSVSIVLRFTGNLDMIALAVCMPNGERYSMP